MIYHILGEPFSTKKGLALSAMAANIMRFEENSMAVTPQSDGTYDLPAQRTLVIPILAAIKRIRGWRYVPLTLRSVMLRIAFAPLFQRLKPGDVVWFFNWNYIADALSRPIHKKGAFLVYHAHNSHMDYAKETKFQSMEADAILFCSEAIRQEVLEIAPALASTYTVHNGVNENLFYPPSAPPQHDVTVILYVGRLIEPKGVHVLLEAMRILQNRGVRAVCKVVGSSFASSGKATPYVEQIYAARPASVEFLGFCDMNSVAEHYRAADILCCPSVWQEPFGNVNVEAMACGVPVVASRVGGIPEIAVEGGVLLVEPNAPEELADNLQRLIVDPALREQIGRDGFRSFQSRFTSAVIAAKTLEIVRQLGSGPLRGKTPELVAAGENGSGGS